MNKYKLLSLTILSLFLLMALACQRDPRPESASQVSGNQTNLNTGKTINPKDPPGLTNPSPGGSTKQAKITFIELGSVNCIPCRMMKKVMDQMEGHYGDRIEIIFYDIWTKDGAVYKDKYGVRAIPTQVFLDSSGQEFHRHIGFFPFEEVAKVLAKQGVH